MSELDDICKRTEGHTPGPWEFDPEEIGSCSGRPYYGIVTQEVSYSTFIRVGVYADDYNGGPHREEECGANAALIASAPDLLRIATALEAERDKLRYMIDYIESLDPVIVEWARAGFQQEDKK